MKQKKDLLNALQAIFGSTDSLVPAVVKRVDKSTATCTIEINDLEVGEVRLQAVVGNNLKGTKLFPAIDSVVLVQQIGNKGEFVIAFYSQLEEINLSVGETLFKQSINGFEIRKNNETLKKILNELVTQVKAITVVCNAQGTPSGVPNNATAFDAITQRINELLN